MIYDGPMNIFVNKLVNNNIDIFIDFAKKDFNIRKMDNPTDKL